MAATERADALLVARGLCDSREQAKPVGISAVGMSGLIWPNAERILARTAAGLCA